MGRWLSDTLTAIPPMLAYLVVGVLATGESVFVGLLLPGELVLLVGGFLAFREQVSLAVMMAVAAPGRAFSQDFRRSSLEGGVGGRGSGCPTGGCPGGGITVANLR